MDNRPSLSQYFSESAPAAGHFFDEIGTSPSDMIQSVYLGDGEGAAGAELAGAGGGALPDPATFFDSIAPSVAAAPAPATPTSLLADAVDSLAIKSQSEDSEADRRDAWIPSEETAEILEKVASSPPGSYYPEREQLTVPSLVLEEELADGLQEVAARHLGVCAAGARGVLRAEHVARDEAGLRELLRTGYLRAALNLTTALLAAAQGPHRARAPRHSPRTLQLWLCRFALMLRLRLLEPLRREAEPFGDLDKPDMYHRFYPESGARAGSLAPFALRLLLAELPQHTGRPELALERLYAVRGVVRRMLANLRAGRAEDGGALQGRSEAARAESLRLWVAREARVAHSLVNCALAMRDYRLAGALLEALHAAAPSAAARRALSSALGRAWLQAGHVARAEAALARAAAERAALLPAADARECLDRGLLEAARGEYGAAHEWFLRAREQDPTSLAAANNLAACLLYTGRLPPALLALQAAVRAAPERALHESLLLNLCTLYELQASHTQDKKLALLRLLCQHRGDSIPDVAECLKLSALRQDK